MTIDLDALINEEPVDKLTAYRDCLIVMLHCAPLRQDELLSITPETAEVFHTIHDGTQHYGWRYKSSKTRMNADETNIILIPDSLVPVAQKAINRLRELNSENLAKKYLYHSASRPELKISFNKYRRAFAEAYYRNFMDTSNRKP